MSNDTNRSLVNEKEEGGHSHAETHTIIYTWTIDEISSFLKSGKSAENPIEINSPKFSTGAKINDSWYLQVVIEKDDDKSEDESWVSIYLYPRNGDQKVRTKYLLFILNNKKEKILKNFTAYNPLLNDYYRFDWLFNGSANGYGCTFVKINELLKKKDELLQNDTLTACVELTVYDEYVAVKNPNNLLEGSERKMSDDYKDLFETKQKCDVIIKVGEEKFDAHKLILITRSSVFNAIFSYDMKENRENEVTIPDINPEVFKKVLKYIYTDKVDDLISFAEELLEAADKYQLFGLKELCECSLSKTLISGNAVEILILADRHNAKRLKEVAVDFIANNWIKFENNEAFKQLEKFYTSLANSDVLRKALNGVKNK